MRQMIVTATMLLALVITTPAHPASSVSDQLTAALLCRGDSMETVRALAAKPNPAFTAKTTGEEMDEVTVLTLHKEIVIEGARTSAVTMSLAQPREDFLGIVYAEMKGDPAPLIKAFGLKEAPRGSELPIGRYLKPIPGKDPHDVCPPTIALTPLGPGRFLFGCGWCNG